jgi:hypothetical protein
MHATKQKRHVPILLWPFWAIFRLVLGIVGFTGKLVGVILGFVLMLVGVILTLTVIGGIVGIPMALIGLLITLISIF